MRTYGAMHLDVARQAWTITAVEPHVSLRLKQIFPKIPKQGLPPFTLAHNPITDADLDWFCSRYPLDMSPADRATMTSGRLAFAAKQAEMERILLPTYEPGKVIGLQLGQELRAYQLQSIDLLRARGSQLNGDEGGLGKTYTAAGFLCAEPTALPAAVVCDPHMQKQWRDKLTAFTTLKVHCVTKGKPYDLPPADVYVFRISQVFGWVEVFATGLFKAVVYDEPQSLRTGEGTAKGKACAVLSAHATWRLGLTATPIYNYGSEMWNIMRFIDASILGDYFDFIREWCVGTGAGWKISDPKALGTYLREQHVMIRRLKTDVGQQLPAVSRIVETIEYDAKAVAAVEDLARQLAIKATTGGFMERGQAARDLDIMVRQATGVAKAPTVAKFVRILVEAGEPVIVWGWHREVYDIWMRDLADLNPAMYTGSETAGQKSKELERFISGATDVLFMSLRSGAGVDGLQHRCSTGVFGELDWSPGIHQQCIWRLDREGQKNPVTAFFLVTDDGSDPPMMEVLGIKASEARQIIDPHLGVESSEADAGRLKRLVQRYLERKAA